MPDIRALHGGALNLCRCPFIAMRRTPQRHHLVGAERKRQFYLLRHYCQLPGFLQRRPVLQRQVIEQDIALITAGFAADAFQQAGLARTVGTQHGEFFAVIQMQRYIIQQQTTGLAGYRQRQIADIQHNQTSGYGCCRTCCSSKLRKTGPPMTAITSPTGKSAGASQVRAIMSASSNNEAPSNADAGSSKR